MSRTLKRKKTDETETVWTLNIFQEIEQRQPGLGGRGSWLDEEGVLPWFYH